MRRYADIPDIFDISKKCLGSLGVLGDTSLLTLPLLQIRDLSVLDDTSLLTLPLLQVRESTSLLTFPLEMSWPFVRSVLEAILYLHRLFSDL